MLFNIFHSRRNEPLKKAAALGRPFSLGMLYDCRTDKMVPGLTLWNGSALANHIPTTQNQYTKTRFVRSESISGKANSMGVSAELKLSFLAGLITAEGSGRYLTDTQESSQVVRVTLKYETLDRFEQLGMEHLGAENYEHPEVFENDIATHVVTGIQYGADAFFTFEQQIDTSSTKKTTEVRGKLKAAVRCIALEIQGAGRLDKKDSQNEETRNISCIFHGDFKLVNPPPTTYLEALDLIKSLPQLLKNNPSVPKQVHLHPLCNLNSTAARLERSIKVDLINRVEYILQQNMDHRAKLVALGESSAVVCVPFLKQQVNLCQQLLDSVSSTLKGELLELLPAVRRGEDGKKKELTTWLHKWETCPATPRNFKSVLTTIECTKIYVESLLKTAKEQGIQEAFGTSLDNIISDMNSDVIVCFTFNSDVLSSKILKTIDTYLHANVSPSGPMAKEWHQSRKIKKVRTMKQKLRSFLESAKFDGMGNNKIVFVITEEQGLDSDEPVLIVRKATDWQEITNEKESRTVGCLCFKAIT